MSLIKLKIEFCAEHFFIVTCGLVSDLIFLRWIIVLIAETPVIFILSIDKLWLLGGAGVGGLLPAEGLVTVKIGFTDVTLIKGMSSLSPPPLTVILRNDTLLSVILNNCVVISSKFSPEIFTTAPEIFIVFFFVPLHLMKIYHILGCGQFYHVFHQLYSSCIALKVQDLIQYLKMK